MFWAADKLSRKWFNEIFYRSYEGASEDRLVVLAEELFEDVIKPNIYPRAKELIDECRRAGVRQVLVSGALDFTMRPLARYLGVDDLIANQLEFVDHYATGKLEKPFVAGATKADIMRDYAKQHGIDLAESWAYTDSFSRLPDARRRRPPDRVQPRLPAALARAQLRLAGARSRRGAGARRRASPAGAALAHIRRTRD